MPDPQTARTRQLVALGVGVLLLILIVLGVKGCLDSRQERALKDYSRDASAIVTDSNDQVSKPFFELLESGKTSGNDLQVQVNQVRLTAEEDAKRARELNVPDDMKPAQQNLLTVMNLRSQALTRIAEKLTAAQGRGPQAEAATNEIAGQMQMFLASDVLYSQRAAPLIVQALDEAGISGQTIPESQSLPGYTWLAPDTVAQAIGGTSGGGTTTGGSTCPAGTSCGHGIVSTSIGTTALSDSGSTTVPAKAAGGRHREGREPGRQRPEERDRHREAHGARPDRDQREEDRELDAARHRDGRRGAAAEGAGLRHRRDADRQGRPGRGREDDRQQHGDVHRPLLGLTPGA